MAGFFELKEAVIKDKLNIVKRLKQKGTDINSRDSWGRTVLHHAVQQGNINMVSQLVRLGARINARDIQRRTPLHYVFLDETACSVQNRLIKNPRIAAKMAQAMMTAMNYAFSTLLKATEEGIIELIDCLLQLGADINATYDSPSTSLQEAVRRKNPRAITSLTYLGVDINACRLAGMTCVTACITSAASKLGLHRILKHLVKSGARVNCVLSEETVLYAAVRSKRTDIVCILAQNGADINCARVLHPMLQAVHYTIYDTFKVEKTMLEGMKEQLEESSKIHYKQARQCTVELGADVNALQTAVPLIHEALECQDYNMIRCLVDNGGNIEAEKESITMLTLAISAHDQEMIDFLLYNKVDLNETSERSLTALHAAVKQNDLEGMKVLIELGANVNKPKRSGVTAVFSALSSTGNDNCQLMQDLVRVGATVNPHLAVMLETPIHVAVKNQSRDAIQVLVENGADLNFVAHSMSILHVVRFATAGKERTNPSDLRDLGKQKMGLGNTHQQLTNSLEKFGIGSNAAQEKGPRSDTGLFNLCFMNTYNTDPQLIRYLAKLGVNLNTPHQKIPLIHVAVKCKDPSILFLLVEMGANPSTHKTSSPPLTEAVMQSDTDMIQLLVKLGADVNAIGIDSITPLTVAIEDGNTAMVAALVKCGAPLSVDRHELLVDKCSTYPLLSLAVQCCTTPQDVETLRLLLQLGANVNATSEKFASPLHHAVTNGNNDILGILCTAEPEARLEATKSEKITALHLATKVPGVDLDVVRALVEAGADLNAGYTEYVTPLHVAVKLSNTEAVKCLSQSGVDMNPGKIVGFTPVHVAIYRDRRDVLEYLVQMGADLEVMMTEDVRPLHDAVKAGNAEMVECLVEAGADIRACKKDRLTPMFAAITGSDLETLKCLVRLGANMNATVDKHVYLLHDAVTFSNPHLIRVLVSLGHEVLARKARMSLLAICANSNLIEQAECLLSLGVNKQCSHNVSHTALDDAIECRDEPCMETLYTFTPPSERCSSTSHTLGTCASMTSDNARALENKVEALFDIAGGKGYLDMVRLLIIEGCGYDLGINPLKSLPLQQMIDYRVLKEAAKAVKKVEKIKMENSDWESKLQVTCMKMDTIHCTPGFGDVKCIASPKSTEVSEEVRKLLEMTLQQLHRFPEAKLQNIGSSAEGTKVGLPDEMDFLVHGRLKLNATEAMNVRDAGYGYAHYTKPDETLLKDGSRMFHISFIKDVADGISIVKHSYKKSLQHRKGIVLFGVTTTPYLDDDNRKACSMVSLQWHNALYEAQFNISVDMVPCLHVDGWPSNGVDRTWLMDQATLKSWGYLLVPKPPHISSALAKSYTKDELDALWRVSFAHLETKHMQCLDKRVRDVYLTAKSLRNPDICRILITDDNLHNKTVDKYLTSYMLKMMFLKNVTGFLDSQQSLGAMVTKVYDDLEEGLSEGFIPLFFMPTVSALDGLKVNTPKSAKVAKIMKTFVQALWDCQQGEANSKQIHTETSLGEPRAVYQVIDIMDESGSGEL